MAKDKKIEKIKTLDKQHQPLWWKGKKLVGGADKVEYLKDKINEIIDRFNQEAKEYVKEK